MPKPRPLRSNGIPVIPKSVNPDRVRQNLDVFGLSLDPDEVARIDVMSTD